MSGCELFTNSPLADPAAPDGNAVTEADSAASAEDGAVTDGGPGDAVGDTAGCVFSCAVWDECVAQKCVPKGCTTNAECMTGALPDDLPHFCVKGTCAGYQCADDGDCGPGKKCNTLDYTCYTPATGCVTDGQCADTNACTNDLCNHKTGICEHGAKAGCCNADKDCDDADPKTADTCVDHHCDWKPISAFSCQKDADCAVQNPCVGPGTCAAGKCGYKPLANCCLKAADCDDDDSASTDTCTAAHQCLHQFGGLPSTCATSGDCKGNSCLGGSCLGGACTYTATPGGACCTDDDACQLDKTCQVDACVAHACAHTPSVGTGPQVWWHFDKGLDEWTVQKDHPTAYFHQSNLLYSKGSGALRFGIPGQVSFETGNANKGSALSAAFVVPKGAASVSAWIYLDVEPGTAVHLAGIDIVSGGVTTPLWSKLKDLGGGTTAQTWKQVTASVAPWAGKSAQLRVWFDQLKYDTSNKSKMGFVVDEIVVSGGCP